METNLILRPTVIADLDQFFTFQLDQEAVHLAAFMPKDYNDKIVYISKYTKLLAEPTVHMCTILVENQIVGSISKFELDGNAEITYWIDRHFWGKGIGATALQTFLQLESMRPIIGRVAFDNVRSQKVLEHGGFQKIRTDKGFASARQKEIEEYIYQLG